MAGSIALEFPSDYKYLNIVDLVCGEIMQGLCCAHDTSNEIAISVIEACTNAIEHGNENQSEQTVRVAFRCEPGRLVIEVQDCGEGFDFTEYMKNLPDPSDTCKMRGRGIVIMNSMMDSLGFEMVPGKGMKVTLEKRFQPAAPAPAEHETRAR